MENTVLVDADAEPLLRHFCLEEQVEQVKTWFNEQGYTREDDFDSRVELCSKLKSLGNQRFQASDFLGAMMHALGALHCVDFSQARAVLQSEDQKKEVLRALVPVLSNLCIVFLKRGDAYNAARAADLGLDRAKKLPDSEVESLRAKLLFRRGLARGQNKDFTEALPDLKEAARLMPQDHEVRKALENCKKAVQSQRGEPDDKWRGLFTTSPDEARKQARSKRTWQEAKLIAAEVRSLVFRRENIKFAIAAIVVPVLASYYAARLVKGRLVV